MDVVSHPTAHQVNLQPQTAVARAVVLALPRPLLCAGFEPERFSQLRAVALQRLAARVGGGEGPVPVIDLEDRVHALPLELERLRDAGIERLVLFGASERPDFAREISLRFAGGVESRPDDALLYAARFAPSAVVSLGAGLYRVDVGAPVPAQAEAVLFRDPSSPFPPICSGDTRAGLPFAHDPDTRLGAAVGLLPPEALVCTDEGATLRAHWAGHFPPELLRSAVLGIHDALEAALAPATGPDSPEDIAGDEAPQVTLERELTARMWAVTGMDGSGKSTHVAHLANAVAARGLRVAILKLYRQGAFLALADDLSARTRRGAPLSAFRLSRCVKLWDSLRMRDEVFDEAAQSHDILILDRWVETHLAAASSQLGWDLRHHGALAAFPKPRGCAWLLLPPEVALERLTSRGLPLTADEHAAGLAGYARAFDALSQGPTDLRLDAQAAEADNALNIRHFFGLEDVDPSITAPVLTAPTLPVQAPGALPMGARAEVVLGFTPDLPVIGTGCLAALPWAGELSRGFVLEGIASRCVLDLREKRPARACAPLWPAVLARLYPDLTALSELDHLLAAEARVVGYLPPRPEDFGGLATGGGAVRFAAAYGRALAEVAEARGWRALSTREMRCLTATGQGTGPLDPF